MTPGCGQRCWWSASGRAHCTCVCRGWNHGTGRLIERARRDWGAESEEFAAWLDGLNGSRRSPSAPAAVGGVLL